MTDLDTALDVDARARRDFTRLTAALRTETVEQRRRILYRCIDAALDRANGDR